jgi:hypothetical protein
MNIIDKKRFEEKLKGYERVDVKDLKAEDHIRYVKKEFKSEKYKCVYCIVDSAEEGQNISVHSYVPKGCDDAPYSWVIKTKSIPYVRFYKKVN